MFVDIERNGVWLCVEKRKRLLGLWWREERRGNKERVAAENRGEERERAGLRGEKRGLGLGFVLRIIRNKSKTMSKQVHQNITTFIKNFHYPIN